MEQLASMGFGNREANLQGKRLLDTFLYHRCRRCYKFKFLARSGFFNAFYFFAALMATFGDVNAAVEHLLTQPPTARW